MAGLTRGSVISFIILKLLQPLTLADSSKLASILWREPETIRKTKGYIVVARTKIIPASLYIFQGGLEKPKRSLAFLVIRPVGPKSCTHPMAAKRGGMAKGSKKRNRNRGFQGISVLTTIKAAKVPTIVDSSVAPEAIRRLLKIVLRFLGSVKTRE